MNFLLSILDKITRALLAQPIFSVQVFLEIKKATGQGAIVLWIEKFNFLKKTS
jgi:hypothetical protein